MWRGCILDCTHASFIGFGMLRFNQNCIESKNTSCISWPWRVLSPWRGFVGFISWRRDRTTRGWSFCLPFCYPFVSQIPFCPMIFMRHVPRVEFCLILLLGFLVQSITLVASPFFDYQGLPRYVPRAITFWELCGDHRTDCTWYYSTSWKFWTVLFLGVVSHMAAVTALPANCKMLICGGFTGVILSIGLIKSMHLRRVPLNPSHRQLLYAAYTIQVIVLFTVAYATASMSINRLSTQL